jgi:hypothetical protein
MMAFWPRAGLTSDRSCALAWILAMLRSVPSYDMRTALLMLLGAGMVA